MIFFLDADFPEITQIIESHNWSVKPKFSDNNQVSDYELFINNEFAYKLSEQSYKRFLNAMRNNRPVTKIYLCRNCSATFD